MGELPKVTRGSSGFSMIEVMIAGGLIAFIAVALMPAVFSVVDTSKSAGFRGQCVAAVRAKLQEYMNGVADNSMGTSYIPTGFEYSKKRFRDYGYAKCSLAPSADQPGFRESVYGNTILTQTQAETVSGKSAVMKGFQLWVMMRQYNPRKLQSSGTYSSLGQPSRDCPTNSSGGLFQDYQFYGLGDAIEVTVTGMVRTSGSMGSGGTGGSPVGKLKDVNSSTPNPLLTCAATEIIFPPRTPFRYFLSSDGKIRNYQSAIAFAAGSPYSSKEAMESHFRSVWVNSTSGVTDSNIDTENVLANIRSFAVSPDNQWVYILRPGELSRYGPCYDNGKSVTVNGVATTIGGDITLYSSSNATGSTFKGTPDCPKLPSIKYSGSVGWTGSPDGQNWTVDTNIENIAVDFGSNLDDPTDDKVYGMFNSQVTFNSGTQSGLLVSVPPTSTGTLTWTESTAFTLAKDRPRTRGMYIAQTFPATTSPNLFFFDNTCYTGGNSGSAFNYCATIFNAADTNQQQEMRELPLQVESISY